MRWNVSFESITKTSNPLFLNLWWYTSWIGRGFLPCALNSIKNDLPLSQITIRSGAPALAGSVSFTTKKPNALRNLQHFFSNLLSVTVSNIYLHYINWQFVSPSWPTFQEGFIKFDITRHSNFF